MKENNVCKEVIFACTSVCVFVLKVPFLYSDLCFCFLDQPSSFWHSPFSPPPPIPSLNISWMQESAEKLLDYREYYCGLKYVTLYVGALSPRAIRIV